MRLMDRIIASRYCNDKTRLRNIVHNMTPDKRKYLVEILESFYVPYGQETNIRYEKQICDDCGYFTRLEPMHMIQHGMHDVRLHCFLCFAYLCEYCGYVTTMNDGNKVCHMCWNDYSNMICSECLVNKVYKDVCTQCDILFCEHTNYYIPFCERCITNGRACA